MAAAPGELCDQALDFLLPVEPCPEETHGERRKGRGLRPGHHCLLRNLGLRRVLPPHSP